MVKKRLPLRSSMVFLRPMISRVHRTLIFMRSAIMGQLLGTTKIAMGLYHGVILENGELRQYDFPGAVQTEIYGFSDATGVLTGNFIDDSGVRRGFSGDIIVEVPDAIATYADFVNSQGLIVGSYIDADGLFHAYGALRLW